MKARGFKAIAFMLAVLMLTSTIYIMPISAEGAQPAIVTPTVSGEVLSYTRPAGGAEQLVCVEIPAGMSVVTSAPVYQGGSSSAATESGPTQSDAELYGSTTFCYDRLPADEKALYDLIDAAAKAYCDTDWNFDNKDYTSTDDIAFGVTYSKALTTDQFMLAVYSYMCDHPMMFWCSNQVRYSNQTETLVALCVDEFYFAAKTRQQAKAAIQSAEAVWTPILEACETDYDKLRVMNDLICVQTSYAYAANGAPASTKDVHGITGVVTNGLAVCDGYSHTLQYMLNKQGIDTACVSGMAYSNSTPAQPLGAHMWNAVKLDGKYYLVDVTWNDLPTIEGFDYEKYGYSIYDYFCRDASEFVKTHVPYTPQSGSSTCYIALEDGVFVADSSHEYYTVYGGNIGSITSPTDPALQTFTANLVKLRPDSVMIAAGSSSDLFSYILGYAGVDNGQVVQSNEYGWLLLAYRERRVNTYVPEAPVWVSADSASVTLYNGDNALEFSLDGKTWQSAATFNGLKAGDKLSIYCRYARTIDTYASVTSDALSFIVPGKPITAMSGDTYVALALDSNIDMYFYVPKAGSENYDSVKLNVELSSNVTQLDVVAEDTLGEQDVFVFVFEGIAAKQMAEELKVTTVGYLGDVGYTMRPTYTSVQSYCDYMLSEDSGESDSLKTLCADLLNYGSAAQTFFDYKTDALANATMTDAQRGYATATTPATSSCLELTSAPEAATVTLSSAMLKLDSEIDVALLFESEFEDSKISFDVWIDMNDNDTRDEGETRTLSAAESGYMTYTAGTKSYRMVMLGGIPAACLRDKIYVTAYVNGVAASACLRYSVETYADAMIKAAAEADPLSRDARLANLCVTLMKYADAARSCASNG